MAKSMLPKRSKDKPLSQEKAFPPTETPRFALPSRKQVLDFFYSSPSLQLLYAERVKAGFEVFTSGRNQTYPVHLNTHGDIVEFTFNQRSVKIDSVSSVAEKFLELCINGPTPKQEKRKREKDDSTIVGKVLITKDKQVAKSAPKQKATVPKPVQPKAATDPVAAKVGKYNIQARPRKQRVQYEVIAAPNFIQFFSNPRVAIFSSIGGLHDVSCAICAEIGHYNAVQTDGVARKLDLGQKAWVAVLHDITDDEGYIPGGDVSALRSVRRWKEEATMEVLSSAGSTESKSGAAEASSTWANSSTGETED